MISADAWPATMALVLPIVWNQESRQYRWEHMHCRNAGRAFGMRQFVCISSRVTLRSGERREFKYTVLVDGTVLDTRRG